MSRPVTPVVEGFTRNPAAARIAAARRQWPRLFSLAERHMLRHFGPMPLCINGAEYRRRQKGRRR